MDNRVYGLMEAAEAQQQAVERAIEALKTTRQEIQAALAKGSAEGAREALNEAVVPISDNLKLVAQTANKAGKDLSEKAERLHWKWTWITGLTAFGTIAAIALSAWLMSWFQRQAVTRLSAEKALLEMDVSTLQATVVELEEKGGRVAFEYCSDGGKERLCFEVVKDHDKRGFWEDGKGRKFAIPAGY